ncbi:MAG: DNA photolyase FAD-binding protein [Sphingobium sp.]|nr:DNA photolyase FAD-binding protein [Sphingobium sp.]
MLFPPTRAAARDRLASFVPGAGAAYAAGRNHDPGPDAPGAVSRLSPYVRYRMLTEAEIVAAVLARHRFEPAEKFVQEVLWRTYWKGWLEMRPAVWTRFVAERDHQRETFTAARALAQAEAGATGIEGFDDWARELVATGYLHNHARMWFASIWIFTLRLPWALGADFFLRHLIDADAASNTLSWRWVAGLQTVGKTYLATADNIARYTGGRFAPKGLALEAAALTEAPIPAPAALPVRAKFDPTKAALQLVTPEDLAPETQFGPDKPFVAALVAADPRLLWGERARSFVADAAADAAARLSAPVVERLDAPTLIDAARAADVRQIVTPYAPVGPTADALAAVAIELAREGITLAQVRRDWDSRFWPHATKGFFAFKQRIPAELHSLGLT